MHGYRGKNSFLALWLYTAIEVKTVSLLYTAIEVKTVSLLYTAIEVKTVSLLYTAIEVKTVSLLYTAIEVKTVSLLYTAIEVKQFPCYCHCVCREYDKDGYSVIKVYSPFARNRHLCKPSYFSSIQINVTKPRLEGKTFYLWHGRADRRTGLVAESSKCGFKSKPFRQRALCPWARHFTI